MTPFNQNIIGLGSTVYYRLSDIASLTQPESRNESYSIVTQRFESQSKSRSFCNLKTKKVRLLVFTPSIAHPFSLQLPFSDLNIVALKGKQASTHMTDQISTHIITHPRRFSDFQRGVKSLP